MVAQEGVSSLIRAIAATCAAVTKVTALIDPYVVTMATELNTSCFIRRRKKDQTGTSGAAATATNVTSTVCDEKPLSANLTPPCRPMTISRSTHCFPSILNSLPKAAMAR